MKLKSYCYNIVLIFLRKRKWKGRNQSMNKYLKNKHRRYGTNNSR